MTAINAGNEEGHAVRIFEPQNFARRVRSEALTKSGGSSSH